MDGQIFWIVAVMAAICVGMGKGGIPIIAMLGVPIFALVISPVVAAGILLPVYVVSDIFGLWAYRHQWSRLVIWRLIPGAVLGIATGWATAHLVSEPMVTLVIGLIGAVFGANLLLRRNAQAGAPKPARVVPGLFWGALTGFTSFVSHSGGPPYQIYVLPLRLDKAVYAGTSTVAFAIVNAVKLVPYWALGQFSSENLHVAMILMVPASLAVFMGVRLVRMIPAKLFFLFATWSLLLVSLKLVWDGMRGLGWL